MNSAIEQMLKSYHVENIYDRKNAMKEIMQEIYGEEFPYDTYAKEASTMYHASSKKRRSTAEPPCEFSTVSTASPRIWIFRWKRRIWTLT